MVIVKRPDTQEKSAPTRAMPDRKQMCCTRVSEMAHGEVLGGKKEGSHHQRPEATSMFMFIVTNKLDT